MCMSWRGCSEVLIFQAAARSYYYLNLEFRLVIWSCIILGGQFTDDKKARRTITKTALFPGGRLHLTRQRAEIIKKNANITGRRLI